MDYPNLSFEKPDLKTFRNLQLAYDALEAGGTMACALNAANEVAVEAFLNDQIHFTDIALINEKTMNQVQNILSPTLEDYIAVDKEARTFAEGLI